MQMTKDVLIKISGLQAMDGESDDVEIITAGDYFQKNGKHYIIYEEAMEGFEGTIRNDAQENGRFKKRRSHGSHGI